MWYIINNKYKAQCHDICASCGLHRHSRQNDSIDTFTTRVWYAQLVKGYTDVYC